MIKAISSFNRRFATVFVAATALTLGLGVSAAHAVPTISLSDSTIDISEDVPDGSITVTGTDFGSYDAANLDVGVCTVRNIGLYSIPACGWFADGGSGEVTIDGSGNLSATIYATEHPITNVHSSIPLSGQPSTFNCLTEQTSYSGCQVVVVNHSGFSSTFIETAPITFTS